ncbi:hypothetical protein Tco_0650776 [Tanacetum coccineum]
MYNKPKWHNVAKISSFVPRAAYVPAGSRNPPASVFAGSAFLGGSRNPPASVSAGRAFPAGSRNRPASVFAGRPFSAGWRNNADRPMTRPTSHYFQHFRRPGCYNQLFMDEGRWGTAVKTSAGPTEYVAAANYCGQFLLVALLVPTGRTIPTGLGPSSDPNIASSSRPHKSAPDLFTSTNVEDETMGGSFQTLPPRSTQAPPEGTTSGGAEDLDKLTALSSLVSTLVQKLLQIAAASVFPTVGSHEADIPSSLIGKSPLVEEDPPVRERTFRQREEDRLGEEAARRMYEEEQAELEREREEMQKKRQQDVLNSAKYYTDSDWTDIMGQVHANQGLNAELLGPDEGFYENFCEKPKLHHLYYRMDHEACEVTLRCNSQLKTEFDKIRTAAAALQSQNIRRSLKRPGADLEQASSKKSKSTETPKSDVPADSQQPSVEVPSQKATIEDVEVPSNTASTTQHTGSSFKKVGTRKKRLGRKGVHPSHSTVPIEDGDPEAEHKMCLKYASDADSASDDDTPVNLHAVVDWELLPTGLGWINVIYRKDNSRKCFTSLREILHLVTRADLMTIYGRVMTFYQDKKAAGVGLVLWGDLKVLMDSPEVNDGSDVWKHQQTWKIQSWKLYSYSGVHVLETVGGLVVHMFVDKKYPLSVNLIERMLDNQLEICQDTVGNELTTAVQLIAFLKKQIADSRRPKVHDCPYLDADFLVADSKFMKVAFGVDFKILLFNPLVFSTKDLSRNLKLTMSNSSLGEDC